MNQYCVYIIFSGKLDRFYIGSTDDFDIRLQEHNSGLKANAFTKDGIPWVKFLVIDKLTSKQAFAIEKHIKKMKSRLYIKNLVIYPAIIEKLKQQYK